MNYRPIFVKVFLLLLYLHAPYIHAMEVFDELTDNSSAKFDDVFKLFKQRVIDHIDSEKEYNVQEKAERLPPEEYELFIAWTGYCTPENIQRWREWQIPSLDEAKQLLYVMRDRQPPVAFVKQRHHASCLLNYLVNQLSQKKLLSVKVPDESYTFSTLVDAVTQRFQLRVDANGHYSSPPLSK